MLNKDGLIVTIKESMTLRILDSIHKSSTQKIWSCSLVFLFVSFVASLIFDNANIFSASGGIITIVGVFIFTGISVQIELSDIQKHVDSKIINPSSTLPAGEDAIKHIANVVAEVLNERGRRILGAQVTALGTIVWAYGWVIESLICK